MQVLSDEDPQHLADVLNGREIDRVAVIVRLMPHVWEWNGNDVEDWNSSTKELQQDRNYLRSSKDESIFQLTGM